MQRQQERALRRLAELIASQRKVVFITGAGLSAPSGIPTFRGANDAVWSKSVESMGTRQAFRRDPVKWYNAFWLKHFPMSLMEKQPNPGHHALSRICARCPQVKLVTQNIDGLHRPASEEHTHWSEQYVEVHGRLGLYKCTQAKCQYSKKVTISPDAFPEETKQALAGDDDARITKHNVPRCPNCDSPAMPQSLFFDEDYSSHHYYRWSDVLTWLEEADAFVFVGTSFAVNVTNIALERAEEAGVPVFNFNLLANMASSETYQVENVTGSAAETLPQLWELVEELLSGDEVVDIVNCDDDRESTSSDMKRLRLTPPTSEEGGDDDAAEYTPSTPGSSPTKSASSFDLVHKRPGSAREFRIPEAQLIAVPPYPLTAERIHCTFAAENFRVRALESEEKEAAEIWANMCAANPRLFNGLKFRLASMLICDRGRGAELRLRVGLTDYATSAGIISGKVVADMKARGAPQNHFPCKIGVAAVLITSDRRVVFMERSNAVAIDQGRLDLPGGHPEPKQLGLSQDDLQQPDDEKLRGMSKQCKAEIMNSILDELDDELNIPRNRVTQPLYLGTVRYDSNNYSIQYLVRTSLTADEIRERHVSAREAYEAQGLVFLPADASLAEQLEQFACTEQAIAAPQLLRAFQII